MTPTVLYIAGYSRSGSTLLDIVLSAHPQVVGTGELSFLFDDWADPGRRCTCGEPYPTCPFWSDLYPDGMDPVVRDAVRSVEGRASLPRVLRGTIPRDVAEIYARSQTALLDYVAERAGRTVVVDSSKSARATAGRSLALERIAGVDVRVVHLVRDILDTVASYRASGSNWVSEGHGTASRAAPGRAAVGWVLSNATATATAKRARHEPVVVRHEDFLAEPAAALRSIGASIGLDLSGVADDIERGAAFSPGHQVGGNRLRLASEVRVRVGSDRASSRLPGAYRVPLSVLSAPQRRRFGYQGASADRRRR